jgi:hypothetical protein
VVVEGGGVVKRTDLFQNLLSYVSLVSLPVGRRTVEHVVQLHPRPQGLQFLPQHDVLFRFIGEKQDELDVFLGHSGDLPGHLVAGSNATASSHEEDPLVMRLHPILLSQIIPKITFPPS